MKTTTEPTADAPRRGTWIDALGRFDRRLAWLLFVVAALVYLPATEGGFLWDDDDYVQHNPTVAALGGLRRIWFELTANKQYYPLVHSSFWLEWRLWGDAPAGYHLVNLLLHAGSAVLLYRLLARLRVPGAFLGAALFALHPLQVESVAWVTERKNVLSGLFYLLAATSYLRWSGIERDERGPRRAWILAFVCFLCALFSKTVTASLPAALLVVLWWKRGRLRARDVAPLVPFVVVGVAMGLLTAYVERTNVGATGSEFDLSLAQRALVAGRVPWFYVGKFLLPLDLAFIYPRWSPDPTVAWQWLFPAAVALALGASFLLRGRVGRGPLAALLVFGGTLFPALGFVDVYPFRFSFVADHFQYHASMALAALCGAGVARLAGRLSPAARPLVLAGASAWLLALVVTTWHQQASYRDLNALWTDTLERNPQAWIAHTNLGNVLALGGDGGRAMEHYRAALELAPDLIEARCNLANVLLFAGRFGESAEHLQHALAVLARREIRAGSPEAKSEEWVEGKLGAALRLLGRPQDAERHLRAAVERPPDTSPKHLNLGLVLLGTGRTAEALRELERASALDPADAESARVLAWALATTPPEQGGDAARAEALARRALQRDGRPRVQHALAIALAARGEFAQAIQVARAALQVLQRDGRRGPVALALERGLASYERGEPFQPDATGVPVR